MHGILAAICGVYYAALCIIAMLTDPDLVKKQVHFRIGKTANYRQLSVLNKYIFYFSLMLIKPLHIVLPEALCTILKI